MRGRHRRLGPLPADVMEAAPASIFSFDRDLVVTYVNAETERRWGRNRDSVLGRRLTEVSPEAAEQGLAPWLEALLERGETVDFESFREPLGRWEHTYAFPTPNGVTAFIVDVTATKRLEEERERLASFPDMNPNPIVEVDAGGLVYANPAALERFPDLANDWRGSELLAPLATEDRLPPVRTGTHEVETSQGTFLLHAFDVPDARTVRVYGLDITQQQRDRRTAREAEERYRAIVEQLPAITYVDDEFRSGGRLIYISPQAEAILGVPPEEWVATPDLWLTLVHPDDRDRVRELAARCREQGTPFEAEYRMIARDGRVVWFHDRTTVLQDEHGVPIFNHGVMLDVTERKVAEEALRRREAILEAVTFATNRLLRAADWQTVIDEVLARVGRASGVERAAIVEIVGDQGSRHAFTVREWCAPGFPSLADRLQDVDLEAVGSGWVDRLSAGEAFCVSGSEVPEADREALQRMGIRSVAMIPLFAGDRLWGFASFWNRIGDRGWSALEVEALSAAADAIGSAISRGEALVALERSEHEFRSLAENAPDLIVRFDAERRILYANPAVAGLGYRPETVIGVVVDELDLPGRLPDSFDWLGTVHRWREAMDEVFRTGRPRTDEFDFPAPSGLRRLETRMVPEVGPDGEVETVLLLGHDVTERRRTELELRERMRELTCMVGVSHDVQADLPLEELCARTARHLTEAMRYSELACATVRINGCSATEGGGEDLRVAIEVPVRSSGRMRGRIAVGYPRVHDLLPEEHVVVESVAEMLGMWLQRHEAQTELRESEGRFRRLAENAADLIYRYRLLPTPGFEYVSPAATAMTGYSPEEHYADPELGFKLVHPEDRHLLEALLALEPGRPPEPKRLRWVRKDGRLLWTEQRNVPVFDDDGRLVAVEGIARDITDSVRAEERLRTSYEALRRGDAQRRLLLARLVRAQEEERQVIANDIHDDSIQIMTAVGMRLSLLRREVSTPEAQEALENAEETVRLAIQRLRRLLFELYPPSLDELGLSAALRDHLRLLEEEPEHPRFQVEGGLPEEPPAGSRTILYRIAQEALANVRKYARAREVRIVLEPKGGGVRMRIEDDGVGFDPAAVRQLPGHLGLTSMIERARLAGGWCRFDSAPGHGTTVECWVPAIAPLADLEPGDGASSSAP